MKNNVSYNAAQYGKMKKNYRELEKWIDFLNKDNDPDSDELAKIVCDSLMVATVAGFLDGLKYAKNVDPTETGAMYDSFQSFNFGIDEYVEIVHGLENAGD